MRHKRHGTTGQAGAGNQTQNGKILPLTVVVRGTGDVASAIAHLLFGEGYNVVCHDVATPAHSRRGMAFVDAVFDGTACLADVRARRVRDFDELPHILDCHRAIPISTFEYQLVLDALHPDIVVDARMRKRSMPERQIGLAQLTIGVGPNFIAGKTVDVAIETAWGTGLGEVIVNGPTRDLGGEPRELGGSGRERYVYAPCPGVFLTNRRIGDSVIQGQSIANLGGRSITAPLSGRLRGLTRDGVPVMEGAKIIEIDPRGEHAVVFGLGERPQRIARGVLRAIDTNFEAKPSVFRFESDFLPSLECVPMLVRFKLDACGLKLSLDAWRKLPLPVRQLLLRMPAGTDQQIFRYQKYLTEMIDRWANGSAQSIAAATAQTWSNLGEVAVTVRVKAREIGVNPPSIADWRRLTPLQRYALVKLTKSGRGGRNFLLALEEFRVG